MKRNMRIPSNFTGLETFILVATVTILESVEGVLTSRQRSLPGTLEHFCIVIQVSFVCETDCFLD